MSRIAAIAPVLPEYSYSQAEITAELSQLIAHDSTRRTVLERLHASSGIGRRHTALPLERYRELGSFSQANDLFITIATDLLETALRDAIATAGIAPTDIDYVLFTSVTGIAAPSIDALLVPRVGLRPDVKRMPSFGLGCVAGAAGLARVNDYLAGHPTHIAVLLSVELCSLTLQRDDETIANFVASGLFGDGATAVIVAGDEVDLSGPRIVATRSALYPDSTDVIGWNIGGGGFEIVLTAGVADVIAAHFPSGVADFLADNELEAVDAYVAHPGGPKVLEAFETALGEPRSRFARSWDSLERVGNLSSSAVLHVLADTVEAGELEGSALLFALGPGVSAEFVLLDGTA
jgi:alkylresorcinol/alkylpyrone synthase